MVANLILMTGKFEPVKAVPWFLQLKHDLRSLLTPSTLLSLGLCSGQSSLIILAAQDLGILFLCLGVPHIF